MPAAEPAEREQRGGGAESRARLGNQLERELGEARDPFDQPAVEAGKVLTRRYLEGR